MSGFSSVIWEKKPKKRKAKSLWNTVRHSTGLPPTCMEYHPPNRWSIDEDSGERIWRKTAEWVIHHELGMFRFKGSAKVVSEQIETEGLN